ncbi:MAG: PAS domain-containing protein [Caulobacter sp.]|nr:PAS domain-containing protein [Caulobacter sp.]
MAPSDAERVAEIRSLDVNALRPVIDRVTRLARRAADAPYAYVVLVEEDHVWHSGFDGLPEHLAARSESATARHLDDFEPLWNPDVAGEWASHDWVKGFPYIRGYANAPVVLANGVKLGALCLVFTEPRGRDEAVIATLVDLAALLAEAIERLRAGHRAELAQIESRAATALKDAVMHSSPVALGISDRHLRYVYVNEQWAAEKGIPADEAVGQTMADLFPKSFPQLEHFYNACLAGETITSDRILVPSARRPDRWLRATVCPWRDSDGEIGGIITMSHDISDVVETVQRAQRSESRLKLALEIAEVLVYEVNYRDKTLKVDGAADTFFEGGLTYDDVSRDIWVTVHPDDREEAQAHWNDCIATGEPFRTEYRMNRPDGREVWAFSASELLLGEDGRVDGVLGVLKNITSRKHVEEATVRARDLAEAANRAKSEFLANMSHEIRTPLNGVMGVASALARTDLNPAQTEMVSLIETSGQTLEAILADVLDIARIESGRLELKPEPFDLGACLRSAASLFRPSAAEKNLNFTLAIGASADGAFIGDAVRLRQILCNLLSNAIKFTRHGGVSLEAATGPDGRLVIAVVDSGIGFGADVRDRLFERFEQADGSITRRFGGTGLGLAISRALAEAMGGTLEAQSTPGEGSRFVLTVDLERWSGDLTESAQVAAFEPSDGRAPRVLLAEDHVVNRKVVELLFDGSGVELTCVENGAEAVEAAAGASFDLILMDMQMPVMDGLTAIRTIRAAEVAGGGLPTPIWALSANALPEHVAASMAAGADGHLSKPVSAEALFGALAEACARAMPEDEALSA